jgi:hypothetical protein
MMARMDTPPGAADAPTVCASQGCENLLAQPAHSGPTRRYCSDSCRSADRRRRSGRAGGSAKRGLVPLSVVHEDGGAGLVVELRSLSARLAELAHAVDSALVEAEVDAVSARVASIEATAAEHLAERQAAEERQAGLAAEEAAEVAEERAAQLAAQADQDAPRRRGSGGGAHRRARGPSHADREPDPSLGRGRVRSVVPGAEAPGSSISGLTPGVSRWRCPRIRRRPRPRPAGSHGGGPSG